MPDAVIHVVDDDEPARESLAFLLRMEGFEVRVYAAAEEFLAVAAVGLAGPVCLVTDIAMPRISGIALLQQLRTLGIAIPAIVATGHADDPLAVEAMRAGAADCLQKPYDADVLLKSIAWVLDRSGPGHAEEQAEILRRMVALSPMEVTILKCLLKGRTLRAVADALGLNPHDIEIQRAAGMRKLGAASFVDLVRMIFRCPPGATPLDVR